jgi:hypothetical protein
MARRPNGVSTVTITISTTEGIEQYLDDLVAGGLFGKNRAEVAERLVARGVENLLREEKLTRRKVRIAKKSK